MFKWLKRIFFYDEMQDVRDFYKKFKQPVSTIPTSILASETRLQERINFMQEELDEFKEGKETNDLPLMADSLIDLVYVIKGTAIEMGLPWEELWMDVQRANMAKVIGVTKRGIKIDVAKPPGWVGPKTTEILAKCLER
jgi:predicted HAD superfamily Cof-like phosphohydrolase